MITIVKSPSADSRSAKEPPTPEILEQSTKMHISDVTKALTFISNELISRAQIHDHTKLDDINSFCTALNSGKIKETEWYQHHITDERHHLKSHVPDDVNLIDVIEHVVDCTMAGMARSGEVFDVDLSPDILTLAVNNTVKLLKDNTTIIDTENETDIMDEEIKED